MKSNPCPCKSKKPFQACCEPLLMREKIATTPSKLMRSRYSAYALGGYGDYLLETWLPSSAMGLSAADLSVRSLTWVDLTVLNKSQQGESGFVEFRAAYLDELGQRTTHHEKSTFSRVKGRWFYVGEES